MAFFLDCRTNRNFYQNGYFESNSGSRVGLEQHAIAFLNVTTAETKFSVLLIERFKTLFNKKFEAICCRFSERIL